MCFWLRDRVIFVEFYTIETLIINPIVWSEHQ